MKFLIIMVLLGSLLAAVIVLALFDDSEKK